MFENCWNLSEVSFDEGISAVGEKMFKGCSSLSRVTLPSTLTDIGAEAFSGCSNMDGIVIPEEVSTIYSNTFTGCIFLSDIWFRGLSTTIQGTGTISKETTIYAFKGSKAAAWAGTYKRPLVLLDAEADGDFLISNGVLTKYVGTDIDIVIPNGVTSVANRAFIRSGIRSITFPASVTQVADDSFYSNIQVYVYSDSVLVDWFVRKGGFRINFIDNAFAVVDGILYSYSGDEAYPEIPAGVRKIAKEAFADNRNIIGITIPEGVTEIGENAFKDCNNLQTVQIADSVNKIGTGAFADCISL